MKRFLLVTVSLVFALCGTVAAQTTKQPGGRIAPDEVGFAQAITQGQLLIAPAPDLGEQDRFLVAQDDEPVHCYGADGKEIWAAKVGKGTFKNLGGAAGAVVISNGNQLVGVDWKTGKILWTVPFAKADSYIALCSDLLLTQTADAFEAHSAATGQLLWKTPMSDEIDRLQNGSGRLILEKKSSRKLILIDAKSGKTTDFPVPTKSQWFGISPRGDLLILSEGHLSAYSPPEQKQLWSVALSVNPLGPSPVVGKQCIAVLDSKAGLVFFDPDGKEFAPREKRAFELEFDKQSKLYADAEHIFVQTSESVRAYDISNGRLDWVGPPLADVPPICDIGFEPHLVVSLRQGNSNSGRGFQTRIVVNDRATGKVLVIRTISIPTSGKNLDKSDLHGWTIINGAAVFDIDGHIHILRFIPA
jgi:hypothetical protein